ncbi:DNA-binding transcriptional regulator, LysR family [Formivibrio citricus]|uniref:DNA-binding transcriptional regulator, LysR family n=1 Tax=Formivibrio citricus TaxID=83765 RepID=A0A1I5E228_9NEIS|nr:LysR substrate-binding domain-containing protein [Formivibrio citricus]SFO05433.1 DNA-binding transcriptional regulator, LysR family [Formivibrio citricus]
MDALTELEFFSILVKAGSLSAAARELDLTPPAISKRLAQLEARLGVRLLNRTTRHISVTSEGAVYLNHARRILRDIQEMEQEVLNSRSLPKGLLRVNATLGFGRTYIAPTISAFIRQYPDMEVQLNLSVAPQNIAEGDIDVGIRFGLPPDSNIIARKIMPNRRFICASPLYLKKFPAPVIPSDLAKHNCIVLRQDETACGLWRFRHGDTTDTVKVKGALSSNDGEVVLNWALEGHGILMRAEWDIAKYLRSGRLVRLLSDYNLPSADIYAVYPERHYLSTKVRVFIDFLAARFSEQKPAAMLSDAQTTEENTDTDAAASE